MTARQPDPRAVIYCRVSTEEQAEHGTSLDTQELACLRRAAELGAPVVAVHKDEGVSGAYYLTRPGIQKALADIEAGRANILIVAKLDRSGRDVDVMRDIRRRVECAGARLVFCDGLNFENNAVGRLAFTTLAGFAEFEREIIRERTAAGRRRRAEEGVQPSRTSRPFGYHLVTKQDVIAGRFPAEELGRYHVIEEEASIIRDLFERYGSGESLRAIANDLNAQGVPTAKGGRCWGVTTVRVLISNPLYHGAAVFGKSESLRDESRVERGLKPEYRRWTSEDRRVTIPAPALVSRELWDECQRRFAENRSVLGGNPRRRYLLSGFLRCPECGGVFRGMKVKTGTFYCCAAHSGSDPTRSCGNRDYHRAERLESLVLRGILAVAARPELVSDALRAYDEEQASLERSGDTAPLVKALAALAARERATVQAQIAGIQQGASPSAYAAVFAALATERKALEVRLDALESAGEFRPTADPVSEAEKLQAVLQAVELVLTDHEIPVADRHAALAMILQRVEPTPEGVSLRLRGDTVQSICFDCTVSEGAVRVRAQVAPLAAKAA